MTEKFDLMETANRAGNYRVFLQALETADLKQTLKDTGPYTVLAPVDEAFKNMPKAKFDDLFKAENKESLQSLLRNHILPGKILTKDLEGRNQATTMGGNELKIDTKVGLRVNEAKVISSDLKAANGILHGIDKVITPQVQAAAAG